MILTKDPNGYQSDNPERKYIGYWRVVNGRGYDEPAELPDPHDFVDDDWARGSEHIFVSTLVQTATPFAQWRGVSHCRCCDKSNGSQCLTMDGSWVWPQGFAHYIQEHNVRPPQEFLDYLSGLDSKLVGEVAGHQECMDSIIARWTKHADGEDCPRKGTRCTFQAMGYPRCHEQRSPHTSRSSGSCWWASDNMQTELEAERVRHKAALAPFVKVPWASY